MGLSHMLPVYITTVVAQSCMYNRCLQYAFQHKVLIDKNDVCLQKLFLLLCCFAVTNAALEDP